MKVDYLSEFGFRLSDYGEYGSGAGEGRGRRRGAPTLARGRGRRERGRARAGAPLGLGGRPGPPTRRASINSFSFSLINSRAEKSCFECAVPERQRERGGREKLSLSLRVSLLISPPGPGT